MKQLTTVILAIVMPFILVAQDIPDGYYDGTDGLSGQELKLALHHIIKDHRVRSYSEFRDTILPDLDEDPENPDNIILFYKNNSIPKSDFASNNESDFWNREHTWPSSHGFSDTSDTTYTDVHNLRPSDATVNSSKSNKDFDDVDNSEENEQGEAPDTYTTSDFWEPRDEIKGDVARILFYMTTRYESSRLDLELVDRISFSGDPELGVLYTMIRWHENDPVDQYEIDRHEGAYGYQENRNPYVDHPEWVEAVFGSASAPLLLLDQSNFSADFGQVSLGSSFVQSYGIDAYNLSGDVTVTTEDPFSLSTDGADFSNTITLTNSGEDEESFTVYVKFEPVSESASSEVEISHVTEGYSTSLTVTGAEGEIELIDIAAARAKDLEEVVYITGVVINSGNNSQNNKYIYDGTAGIVVRSFDEGHESANLVQGDSVLVKGPLNEYNSLLQIEDSPITIEVVAQGKSIPEPQEVTISEISEAYEAERVLIKNVTFDDAGETFSFGNTEINDETGTLILRIGDDEHPAAGESIPVGTYDITGFVGQFGSDYQLYIDTMDDIAESPEAEVPILPISEVRPMTEGTQVKIKGIVLGGEENNRYNRVVYDGTAGLVIRSTVQDNSTEDLVSGDSVIVEGEVLDYNGLLELEGELSIELLSSGNDLPEPQAITVAEIGEDDESELIQLTGVSFIESGVFQASDYTLTDGTNEITFGIGLSTHPLVGTEIPDGSFDLTAYVGQNSDGYILYARGISDITNVEEVLSTYFIRNDSYGFQLYPNPVEDYFELRIANDLLENSEVYLMDVSGKRILSQRVEDHRVNVQGVEPGVYMVYIENEGARHYARIIVR